MKSINIVPKRTNNKQIIIHGNAYTMKMFEGTQADACALCEVGKLSHCLYATPCSGVIYLKPVKFQKD